MKLKEVFGFKSSSSTLDEAVDMAVGDRTDSFSPMKQNMPAIKSRLSNTQISESGRSFTSSPGHSSPTRQLSETPKSFSTPGNPISLSPSQSAPPPRSSGGSFLGGSPPRLSSASSLPGNLAKRSASPESPGRKKASLFSFGSSKKKEELRGQVEQLQAQLQAQEEELQQLRQRDEQVQQQVHHMGSALQIEQKNGKFWREKWNFQNFKLNVLVDMLVLRLIELDPSLAEAPGANTAAAAPPPELPATNRERPASAGVWQGPHVGGMQKAASGKGGGKAGGKHAVVISAVSAHAFDDDFGVHDSLEELTL